MKNMTPYLMFDGQCEAAINFYKDCFNGEIGYMGRYGESPMEVPDSHKDRIMHVEFKCSGGYFMASDHMDNAGYTNSAGGSNVHLSLNFDNPEEMHQTFERLKAGGVVTMPIKEQFWGDSFGMLTDQFGIHWMFNYSKGNKEE